MVQQELHRSGRAGWLRAAVLGADDGVVSTASLVLGVAAAAASGNAVLLAGVAGLVAGATSMAAGEYVSVSSHGRRSGRHQPGATRASRRPQVRAGRADRALCPAGTGPGAGRHHRRAADGGRPAGSHVRDELGLQPGGGGAAAGGSGLGGEFRRRGGVAAGPDRACPHRGQDFWSRRWPRWRCWACWERLAPGLAVPQPGSRCG
jgi:hypothetical protein